MRLRVNTDGSRSGTHIFDADTGEEITAKVRLLKIWLFSERDPITEVTLRGVDIEINGEVDV
jgi:hypothetical protein